MKLQLVFLICCALIVQSQSQTLFRPFNFITRFFAPVRNFLFGSPYVSFNDIQQTLPNTVSPYPNPKPVVAAVAQVEQFIDTIQPQQDINLISSQIGSGNLQESVRPAVVNSEVEEILANIQLGDPKPVMESESDAIILPALNSQGEENLYNIQQENAVIISTLNTPVAESLDNIQQEDSKPEMESESNAIILPTLNSELEENLGNIQQENAVVISTLNTAVEAESLDNIQEADSKPVMESESDGIIIVASPSSIPTTDTDYDEKEYEYDSLPIVSHNDATSTNLNAAQPVPMFIFKKRSLEFEAKENLKNTSK